MLKLKNKVFNRKIFELKYKEEIEKATKSSIKYYLRKLEYTEESYVFISGSFIEIFLNSLSNIRFLKIREKIYEMVDDLNVKVSFFDISIKENRLKECLFREGKELINKENVNPYKTTKQRAKEKLKKRIKENKRIKKENRIDSLRKRIKSMNIKLIRQKFKINVKKRNRYVSIKDLKNFRSIDKKFLKYLDFFKEIGASRLETRKLVSEKYMFSIKKRSVVAFHKTKKRHFSMKNIIESENEIKNLFKI